MQAKASISPCPSSHWGFCLTRRCCPPRVQVRQTSTLVGGNGLESFISPTQCMTINPFPFMLWSDQLARPYTKRKFMD